MSTLSFLLTSDDLQALQLDLAPDGWSSLNTMLVRDETYHGVNLTVTSELTFWKQGSAYLRALYSGGIDGAGKKLAAKGVEAVAFLSVYEKDANNYNQMLLYRARVDFTQYRYKRNGGVTVKLKEGGLTTLLLSRADTEIDLFGNNTIGGSAVASKTPTAIQMHSQMLRLKYEATQKEEVDLSPGLMTGDGEDLSHEQLLYFGFDTQGDNDLGLEPVGGGFTSGDRTTVVPIYVAKENGAFTISLDIRAKVNATNNGRGPGFETVEGDCLLRIVHRASTAGGTSTEEFRLIPDFYSGGLDGDYFGDILTGQQTFKVDMRVGDEIYLYARYFVHDIGGFGTQEFRYNSIISAKMFPLSYFRILAESTTDPTICRGILVHEAFDRLTSAISDSGGRFYSEHFGRMDTYPQRYTLDGPGSLRLLTNGFGLRGFPLPTDAYTVGDDGTDPRKPLTASFTDVYSSLDDVECLGAGIEQRNNEPTIRIENRAHFYQPTETLRLGAVQGLEIAPYLPAINNQLSFGYKRWQSGAAVGLDEFNGQRTYTLPLTQVNATYLAISSIIVGGYLIEEARRQQYVLGTNKEGQADQELFMICLRRTPSGGFVTEKNEAFTLVKGILDTNGATTYNLRLSPGRMLRKHGPFVRAGLVPQAEAGKRLALGKVEGNDKLVTQMYAEPVPINEHADVMITDLAPPLFVAETYEFTVKLRRNQYYKMVAKPYGLVTFLDGKERRKGWLLKMESEPDNGQAKFTLLRAAD